MFTMKTLSSSLSSISSMKIKTVLRAFVLPRMYPISRAFGRAKSFLLKLARDIHFIYLVDLPTIKKNKSNKQKKLFFGSFRLHYNWCSSHVMPLGQESYNSSYDDPCWNSVIKPASFDKCCYHESDGELSRYLQWLEEKGNANNNNNNSNNDNQEYCSSCNEIDKLADMFIANCHEKFRLEKQESYRRFQEMLARSV
ncbi:hypothetical protein STAS_34938 [Striga asiatica]|uniref:Uncharacterized protein n=1 Tax=Striga asiatica TaxID=4170 RepID=A0A5A7RIZ7_STRAF|nr:hypothetical protein STAS_34938 [Striga asiatica]